MFPLKGGSAEPHFGGLSFSLSIHLSSCGPGESFSSQLPGSGRSLNAGPKRAQRLGHKNRHFVFSSPTPFSCRGRIIG